MSRLRKALLTAGLVLSACLPAKAETLIAALSTHQIAITSNYTGDQLTVFGLVEREGRTAGRAR